MCDVVTNLCGMCLVFYCVQFTDWLKSVLNLVSLESDLSVSEISQTLGSLTPHPTWQPAPGLPHLPLQHPGPAAVQVRKCFYVLCVITAVIVFLQQG